MESYTDNPEYWHGKNISVYRSGAKVLQLYSPSSGSPCILGKVFYNGQMQTKMIKEHDPSVCITITSYNEGKQVLRRYFDKDGMLKLYVECRGAIDHGRFCRNTKGSIQEATNDNGYLSGSFIFTYTKGNGSFTGSFRSDAKIREIPNYSRLDTMKQELVGEFILHTPTKYQYFNFDTEGLKSGVQIESAYRNPMDFVCNVSVNNLLLTGDGVTTTKRYFLHGTEYSSTIYYTVLDNLRHAITASTQLLPELVTMVMAYT
jgi:hypothetical protein